MAWDRSMTADSTDAYLYAEFRTQLVLGVASTDVLAPLRGPHGFPAVFQPWFVPEPRLATALTSVVANTAGIGIDIEAVAVAPEPESPAPRKPDAPPRLR